MRQLCILVVEDEYLIAAVTCELLKEWGYSVMGPVGTSEEALDLINQREPDAALLDVYLDGQTSERVAEKLMELKRPFLVMTAYAARDIPSALRGASHLRKPVRPELLEQALARLVGCAA